MATEQERYYEFLIERVRTDQYPSGQLLDRIEAAIWTPEQVQAYVDVLLDKLDESWYPSGQLMDRVQRMLAMVAAAAA